MSALAEDSELELADDLKQELDKNCVRCKRVELQTFCF
jgi:hypothetical protein